MPDLRLGPRRVINVCESYLLTQPSNYYYSTIQATFFNLKLRIFYYKQ